MLTKAVVESTKKDSMSFSQKPYSQLTQPLAIIDSDPDIWPTDIWSYLKSCRQINIFVDQLSS